MLAQMVENRTTRSSSDKPAYPQSSMSSAIITVSKCFMDTDLLRNLFRRCFAFSSNLATCRARRKGVVLTQHLGRREDSLESRQHALPDEGVSKPRFFFSVALAGRRLTSMAALRGLDCCRQRKTIKKNLKCAHYLQTYFIQLMWALSSRVRFPCFLYACVV